MSNERPFGRGRTCLPIAYFEQPYYPRLWRARRLSGLAGHYMNSEVRAWLLADPMRRGRGDLRLLIVVGSQQRRADTTPTAELARRETVFVRQIEEITCFAPYKVQ